MEKFVHPEGPSPALIMLIGEAPGRLEASLGRPFIGSSGQLLRRALSDAGFSDNECLFANTINFRPANNRTPTPDEIALYQDELIAHFLLAQPRILICLGRTAREAIQKWPLHFLKMPKIVSFFYHPAYVLRRRRRELAAWRASFARLAQELAS